MKLSSLSDKMENNNLDTKKNSDFNNQNNKLFKQTNSNKNMVKFQTVKGMRDFLPEDMIKREYVISSIRRIFEKYGFDPLETPAVEYAELLEGKYGEEEKLIYKFKDKAERNLALRYDLTVPLSRIIASKPDLTKPFKRYQISRVWRYDNVQKGRYREIWQCDIDIIGCKSMLAEAELIAAFTEILEGLKFKKYYIYINNRKILDGIARYANVPEDKIKDVFISLDKYEKIGKQGVINELKGRGIEEKSIEKIIKITEIKGASTLILDRLEKTIGINEGIQELRQLMQNLKKLNIKPRYLVNLTLARGLDYYTGPIFEIYIEEPKIGSLGGGGRYDKLIGKLSNNQDIPATGFSLGLDRLIDVLNELNLLQDKKTLTDVFIANVSEKNLKYSMNIATILRRNNIKSQFDLNSRDLNKQLNFANSLGIPFVIIVGDDEIKKKEVKIKNMKKGKESKIKISGIIDFFRNIL